MVTWIIQDDDRESRLAWNQGIIDELDKHGHDHIIVKVIPFSHEVVGGDPVVDGPVILSGSTAMKTLHDRNDYRPGFIDAYGVRESAVMDAIGEHYLNHDMHVLAACEAGLWAGEQGLEFFFVKPNLTKYFPGTVTDPKRYHGWIETQLTNLASTGIARDFDVVVSSIKTLKREWRVLVVDGKVVTASQYFDNRTLSVKTGAPESVIEFAREMVSLYDPEIAYVIDVGEHGEDLKVIEYNGFSAAGMYACDVVEVVSQMNALAKKVSMRP